MAIFEIKVTVSFVKMGVKGHIRKYIFSMWINNMHTNFERDVWNSIVNLEVN